MSVLLTASPAAAALTRSEANLLDAINQVRVAHGLVALRPASTLERAARAHSIDMLRHRYFAHGAVRTRLEAFGARDPILGENLAWGWGARAAPRSIVQMWLSSPEHRANLLRPGFRRVGIAVPVGSFAGLPRVAVVTADFAGS